MIVVLGVPDSSVGLLREGYAFIGRRCDRLGVDAFRTRVLGRPVVCMRGREASRLFYGDGRFTRQGAMPPSTVRLLQDKGSVQALDGGDHRHRKSLFLRMLPQQGQDAATLQALFADQWRQAACDWQDSGEVVLVHAAERVLTRTAMAWAGIPVTENQVHRRCTELAAMVAYAGAFGPRNWEAQLLRERCERWGRRLVARVRSGDLPAGPGTILAALTDYRDACGHALPDEVVAVELLNVLRPVVAISRFVVFAALALHQHPHWREVFASGDEADLHGFVQEVRRWAPFFPLIGGRARESFSWDGHRFAAGDMALLDLYGTNHHPDLWPEPQAFAPERFRTWSGDPDTLIPQGGGRRRRITGAPVKG